MTTDELAELFINEFYFPDIQAKGINGDAYNMRIFVKNWLDEQIKVKNLYLHDVNKTE